jgi:Domain of unknown function (DUF4020)
MKKIEFDYIKAERDIRLIACSEPPEEKKVVAETLAALDKLPTARFFTRYASNPNWLEWLDKYKVLDRLFDPHHKVTAIENLLAEWIAERFSTDHHEEVIELICKHNGLINPRLWQRIVWKLVGVGESTRPGELDSWLNLLIKNEPTAPHRVNDLDSLARKLKWPDDGPSIMRLFSHMLTPKVYSQESYSSFLPNSNLPKYEFNLTLNGEHFWLQSVWAELKPHISEIWRPLIFTLQKHILDAFNISVLNGNVKGDSDRALYWRSAIETHEQDENIGKSFDVLIDSARDVLEYLVTADEWKAEGSATIELWIESGVPLLRRIAIHGVSINKSWTSDEKITWLLDKDLIYHYPFKHETFQVIKSALPKCGEESLQLLLTKVLSRYDKAVELDEEINTDRYETFNLLSWMNESAPDNKIIEKALVNVKRENPNFLPREYLDLYSWSSGVQMIEPSSPMKPGELRKMNVSQAVARLVEFEAEDDDPWNDSRRGLLEEFSKDVVETFEWSLTIARYLINEKELKSDVWYHLIKGWEKATLSNEELISVVGLLKENPPAGEAIRAAGELLENKIKAENPYSDESVASMEELSDVLWNELKILTEEEAEKEVDNVDWLSAAINHGSGKIGEFWLLSMQREKNRLEDKWSFAESDYHRRFEDALQDKSYSAQLMRTIFASRIHYLYWIDSDWCKQRIIPLLDFESDPKQAKQAWDGFLVWGQIRLEYAEDIKSLFSGAVTHLQVEEQTHREQLFKQITYVMLGDPGDPPDIGWFYEILKSKNTTENDRARVMKHIWLVLRNSDDDFKKSLWKRWLKNFWSERIEGIGIEFTIQEADQLLETLSSLEPVFEEAVDVACKIKRFYLEHSYIFHYLLESSLPNNKPESVLKIVVHILGYLDEGIVIGHDLKPLHTKLTESLGTEKLLELTNILKGRGVL